MFLPGSGYFVLRIRLEGFVSFSLKVENHFTVSGELLHYYYTFIFYLFSAKHASSQAFPRRWNSFLSRGGRTPTTITYTMHRTYLFTHSSLSATLVRTFTFSTKTRRRHHTWERFFAYDLWFFWYKFRFTLPFLRFSGTLSPLDAYAVLWELLLRTTTTEPTPLWNFQQLGGKHSKHKTSTRRYYLWAVFIIILLNSLIFSTTLGNMGMKCFFVDLFLHWTTFPSQRRRRKLHSAQAHSDVLLPGRCFFAFSGDDIVIATIIRTYDTRARFSDITLHCELRIKTEISISVSTWPINAITIALYHRTLPTFLVFLGSDNDSFHVSRVLSSNRSNNSMLFLTEKKVTSGRIRKNP